MSGAFVLGLVFGWVLANIFCAWVLGWAVWTGRMKFIDDDERLGVAVDRKVAK